MARIKRARNQRKKNMSFAFDCHFQLQRPHSHSLSFLESKKGKRKLQEETKEEPKEILNLLLKFMYILLSPSTEALGSLYRHQNLITLNRSRRINRCINGLRIAAETRPSHVFAAESRPLCQRLLCDSVTAQVYCGSF